MASFRLTNLRMTKSDRRIITVIVVVGVTVAVVIGAMYLWPRVWNWQHRGFMNGWNMAAAYPPRVIHFDSKAYCDAEHLPEVTWMLYYVDGNGNHRMLLTEPLSDRKVRYHALEYDATGKRVDVEVVTIYTGHALRPF